MFTEIRIGGGAIVGVSANIAQTNPSKLRFNPYWWQGGGVDSMLAALMVDLVARPEFREAEESRAIYEVGGVTYGDRDSHRKAGEVVARQEALTGQVTVGVEIRLILSIRLIEQDPYLAPRLRDWALYSCQGLDGVRPLWCGLLTTLIS